MDILERLRRLRMNPNKATGRPSPHKPAMILAVIDTIAAKGKPANRIEFDEILIERFRGYFDVVRTEHDHPHAYYPFFHLRSEGFWIHVAGTGRESVLEAMSTARKNSDITDNIDHVRLEEVFFDRAGDPAGRQELRATIIQEYFHHRADAVWQHVSVENGITAYQRRIEGLAKQPADRVAEAPPTINRYFRDAAFRRVVVPAYDFRCAACGLRLVFDGSAVVEACHLIPWEVSHNDDPRNGMALCRNHHWALDQWLIAPAPDLEWRASRLLDRRLEGQCELLDLVGKPVLLPTARTYNPREDALEYRVAHLRSA